MNKLGIWVWLTKGNPNLILRQPEHEMVAKEIKLAERLEFGKKVSLLSLWIGHMELCQGGRGAESVCVWGGGLANEGMSIGGGE